MQTDLLMRDETLDLIPLLYPRQLSALPLLLVQISQWFCPNAKQLSIHCKIIDFIPHVKNHGKCINSLVDKLL
jgi:hypothetical protein